MRVLTLVKTRAGGRAVGTLNTHYTVGYSFHKVKTAEAAFLDILLHP